jgi:undecaprenyl-diphosphatase
MNALDRFIFQWFQDHHNEWADAFFRDVTSLGSPTGVFSLTMFSIALLWLVGKRRLAKINLTTFLAVVALTTFLKLLTNVPRPIPYDPVRYGLEMEDLFEMFQLPSWPSGHCLHALVMCLTFAVMAREYLLTGMEGAKRLVLWCAFALPALVGLSRCYLGAHWASDVFASLAIGPIIVFLWWKVVKVS